MNATHAAEPTIPGILLAEAIDIDAMLSLRHLARQFAFERDALDKAMADLQSKSVSDKNARLAVARWALGQSNDADTLAAKESSSPLAVLLRGIIAEESKKYDDALKHYQKAASLAPTNPPCVLHQISALRNLGRVDEALETLESLRREFSDQANFAYYEGRCQEDSGNYQQALESYQQAVAMNPQHAESLFHAARLCDLRGLDDEARRYYEKIGSGQGSTYFNACINLSLIYEDMDEFDKAIQCCQRVLNIDPNHTRAKMLLSDAASSTSMYYSPEETKQSERLEAVLRVPVSDFELSVRSRNCLAKMNIMSLGDLVRKTESEMLAYKNFGETSLREIKEMLLSRGLRLGMMREDAATRAAMERKRHGANQEILDKGISELELSVRSRKAMERLNIRTIGDLLERSEAEMASVKNFGRISLNEIKRRLTDMGLSLKGSR